jgi:hypothetical protein
MKHDKAALRKLAARAVTQFSEIGDYLFTHGELNSTVFFLVHGWAMMSMGGAFALDKQEELHEAENAAFAPEPPRPQMFASPKRARLSAVTNVSDDPRKLGVARRAYTRTFDESVDCITAVHTLDVFGKAEEDLDAGAVKGHKKSIVGVTGDVAYVKSPAFFGKSCLWNDEPAASEYGCKTLTRCEFTTITRPDVDYVIAELPYLLPRFLAFRDYVMNNTSLVTNKVVVERKHSVESKTKSWEESTRDDGEGGLRSDYRVIDGPPLPPEQHPSFVPETPETKRDGRNVGWVD